MACWLAGGALIWFSDLNLEQIEPGAPHRGVWLVVQVTAIAATVGLWTISILALKREAAAERS